MNLTQKVIDSSIIATWEDNSAIFILELDLNGNFQRILNQQYKITIRESIIDRITL